MRYLWIRLSASVALAIAALGVAIEARFPPSDPGTYTFVTVAGAQPAAGFADGPAASARFSSPAGIAVDASGSYYVADTGNYTIRKISVDGQVSTLSGVAGAAGHVDGPAGTARFSAPTAMVIGPDGLIYVIDGTTLRRVALDGSVTTIAGVSGVSGTTNGALGVGTLQTPMSLSFSPSGVLYIGDAFVIRTWTAEQGLGTLASVAGNVQAIVATADRVVAGIFGFVGSLISVTPAGQISTIVTFGFSNAVTALTVAPNGDLIFGQGNFRLTRMTQAGTLVGVVSLPFDPVGQNAASGITLLPTGDVAITANHVVQRVQQFDSQTVTPVVTPIAGITSSVVDGVGTAARFSRTGALAVDARGVAYMADHCTIRTVDGGVVTTVAGAAAACSEFREGAATAARFRSLGSLAFAPDGSLYLVDFPRLARMSALGAVTGVATDLGTGAIDVDDAGDVYLWETFNRQVRRITPQGVVTTLGGFTDYGLSGSFGGVVAAADGWTYVLDGGIGMVRRVRPGIVENFAGVPHPSAGSNPLTDIRDGSRDTAMFSRMGSLTQDGRGVFFISDRCVLRSLTADGEIRTFAGVVGSCSLQDGVGNNARFTEDLRSINAGPDGTLFIVDGNTLRIGVQGTPASPVFSASPASTSAQAGASVTFAVTATGNPQPRVEWQTSTDGGSTWTTVTASATVTGTTSSTLQVTSLPASWNGRRIRAVATSPLARVTSSAATITVTGASAAPTALQFGMLRSESTTSQQRVTATYTGPGTPVWSVSADQSWIQLDATTLAAASTGVFLVRTSVLGLTAPTTSTGTVTATAANVGVSVSIPVTLRVYDPAQTNVPVGQVDTPALNATGVQGAIGVTGWVVDDLGILPGGVKIFRNCVTGEPAVNCSGLAGVTGLDSSVRLVEVATAAFVDGGRPDVHAAFASYPESQVAGWGALVLTNMLPRTTGGFVPYGGQGPLTFYVVATDRDGHSVLLGREWTTPGVPTPITMDNDAIAKPFGAIDTPLPGSTISGTVPVFGWALTPDGNTVAGDADDILIPTNGSTTTVFIDGLPRALVSVNQCRGTVGNPVPALTYCNDDIANIFGASAPQATGTVRTANPTRFRNLDAARGGIGSYVLDTTTLTNGLHTIAWSVVDSAGRTEGIGSRFFTVLNGGADPAPPRAESRLSDQPEGDKGVWFRTGFDPAAGWRELGRSAAAARYVEITVADRVELWLGAPVEAAHQILDGVLLDLPVGASLRGPRFAWTPPAGVGGTHHLVFVRGAERIDVMIAVR